MIFVGNSISSIYTPVSVYFRMVVQIQYWGTVRLGACSYRSVAKRAGLALEYRTSYDMVWYGLGWHGMAWYKLYTSSFKLASCPTGSSFATAKIERSVHTSCFFWFLDVLWGLPSPNSTYNIRGFSCRGRPWSGRLQHHSPLDRCQGLQWSRPHDDGRRGRASHQQNVHNKTQHGPNI